MLLPTRDADAFTVSWARCAYRAVVCTWVWPRSFPIMGRLSPRATAWEATLCRRSWQPRTGAATCAGLGTPVVVLRVRCPRWGGTVVPRRGRECARMRVVGPSGSWLERSCREDIGAKHRRDGVWTTGKAHAHPTQTPRLGRTSTPARSEGAKDWETTGVNRS